MEKIEKVYEFNIVDVNAAFNTEYPQQVWALDLFVSHLNELVKAVNSGLKQAYETGRRDALREYHENAGEK